MRVALSIASVLLVALVAGGAASPRTLPIRQPQTSSARSRLLEQGSAQKRIQAAQMQQLARKVSTFRTTTWGCQDTLGMKRTHASVSVWALPQSVAYRGWVVERWRDRASSCLKIQTQRTLPATNDWVTAVNIVQRVYPGTASWMLGISDREGGHGLWVWYGGRHWSGYHVGNDFLGMDTVGGWMQFRFSTFAPYWRHAQEDLSRRGFIVPPIPDRGGPSQYQAWLDPLAQALTAGYMRYYGKDGCHWCL